jgi:hypothetical protein
VFESRVHRRVFGPKRKEVTEGSRELHNKEPNFYPSDVRVIKSRRLRRASHVLCMRDKKYV